MMAKGRSESAGAETRTSKLVQKGEATRNRILDASELLFSRRGYDGTSLRDIASEADVRLGLVHYHFGVKAQILAATIDRNLEPLRAVIQASFDAARGSGRAFTIEDAVRAFILPFLQISADKDHGLRNFVVMTSHLMSSYRQPEVKPSLMRLSAISQIFTSAVRELLPRAHEGDLLTATYLIEAALIFMVQDPGFLDDLSAHHHSTAHLDRIAEATLRFFSAGLRTLVVPDQWDRLVESSPNR